MIILIILDVKNLHWEGNGRVFLHNGSEFSIYDNSIFKHLDIQI